MNRNLIFTSYGNAWPRLFPVFPPNSDFPKKLPSFPKSPDFSPKDAAILNLDEIPQKWERCKWCLRIRSPAKWTRNAGDETKVYEHWQWKDPDLTTFISEVFSDTDTQSKQACALQYKS